jgi:hypothetical protein
LGPGAVCGVSFRVDEKKGPDEAAAAAALARSFSSTAVISNAATDAGSVVGHVVARPRRGRRQTVTSSLLGVIRDDPPHPQEFLANDKEIA